MRAEYNHTTAIWLDAFANPQSIADNCMKLDDIRQVMACYEVMGYKRAVEYRKEEGERRRQEADSTIEANLLPAQLKASAVGLAICVVPVVLVFLLGLAVKWVARGFQKKN